MTGSRSWWSGRGGWGPPMPWAGPSLPRSGPPSRPRGSNVPPFGFGSSPTWKATLNWRESSRRCTRCGPEPCASGSLDLSKQRGPAERASRGRYHLSVGEMDRSIRLEPATDREPLVPILLEADEEPVLRRYLHDGDLYRIVADGEPAGAV